MDAGASTTPAAADVTMHLRTQQNVTVTVHHGTDTNELFVLKKTGQLVTKEFMFNGLSEADCDSVESVAARIGAGSCTAGSHLWHIACQNSNAPVALLT